MVTARDEGADLPTDPTVNLDGDEDVAVGLILREADEVKGSNRDVSSVNKRRPNVELLVSLIRRRYGGSVSDLLAPVSDVGVESVVVDSDVVVWVTRGKRDLEVGS